MHDVTCLVITQIHNPQICTSVLSERKSVALVAQEPQPSCALGFHAVADHACVTSWQAVAVTLLPGAFILISSQRLHVVLA